MRCLSQLPYLSNDSEQRLNGPLSTRKWFKVFIMLIRIEQR